MEFYNLQSKTKNKDINLIFPNWEPENERVVILSPHDDDIFLGAGDTLLAALANKAQIYVVIINDGSGAFPDVTLKDKIVALRRKETNNAFKKLNIDEKYITRLNIPDFSAIHYIGRWLPWKSSDAEGISLKLLSLFRKVKATRLVFPNGYREHLDHTAVSLSAIYDGPQAGDSVMIDYGMPYKIKSFLQYSVWSKFSPQNALINNRAINIRANKAIIVEKEIEQKIVDAINEFKSQEDILAYLLEVRKGREISNSEKFIELYLEIDPRPRFDYKPYKKLISEIDNDL